MTTMLKSVVVALIAVASAQALAQESPWLVRARAIQMEPDNKSSPFWGVGAADTI